MYINVRTRNSEYNPARFTGLIMRIQNPRATALIFRSGKLVCTGARSEQDSFLAAKKFARIIQKLGFPVSNVTRLEISREFLPNVQCFYFFF